MYANFTQCWQSVNAAQAVMRVLERPVQSARSSIASLKTGICMLSAPIVSGFPGMGHLNFHFCEAWPCAWLSRRSSRLMLIAAMPQLLCRQVSTASYETWATWAAAGLSLELAAALGKDPVFSATAVLKTWAETVVQQVRQEWQLYAPVVLRSWSHARSQPQMMGCWLFGVSCINTPATLTIAAPTPCVGQRTAAGAPMSSTPNPQPSTHCCSVASPDPARDLSVHQL